MYLWFSCQILKPFCCFLKKFFIKPPLCPSRTCGVLWRLHLEEVHVFFLTTMHVDLHIPRYENNYSTSIHLYLDVKTITCITIFNSHASVFVILPTKNILRWEHGYQVMPVFMYNTLILVQYLITLQYLMDSKAFMRKMYCLHMCWCLSIKYYYFSHIFMSDSLSSNFWC